MPRRSIDRLLTVRSASGCSTGLLETYAYDDAGNRTSAPTNNTFTYDTAGQLTGCTSGCGTLDYDDAGRTSRWNGWYLSYDGGGRVASACKVDGCATGDKVTMTYDAEGRRVKIVSRPSGGGSNTVELFRYHGGAIAEESLGTVLPTPVRTYVTDEAGAIIKFCDPACDGSNPEYLVIWNGHGGASSIWRINADGTLTLANSFTYSTWGTPTTATHNGIGNLDFRFLYVGRYGVAWDPYFGLDLHLMGARHYSPVLGRFLQPDPSALEANLYAYAGDGPVTNIDPNGRQKLLVDSAGGAPGGGGALWVAAWLRWLTRVGPAGPAIINTVKDHQGRIQAVTAHLTRANIGLGTRVTQAARNACCAGLKGYDAGQLIARILGGRGGLRADNIAAILSKLNRGDLRLWESMIREWIASGLSVDVNVRLIYEGTSTVPKWIVYAYRVNVYGRDWVTKRFPNF
jgi:RHS repeat-associated protein